MVVTDYEARARWALEQIERHVGQYLPSEDDAGRLLKMQRIGETLEGWIAQHTLEDGVGKADLSAPVYGFAPDTDAAFVATINLDGSGVWEKWFDGEKVDERRHGPGETVNWPW